MLYLYCEIMPFPKGTAMRKILSYIRLYKNAVYSGNVPAKNGAVFLMKIGGALRSGKPHDRRRKQ